MGSRLAARSSTSLLAEISSLLKRVQTPRARPLDRFLLDQTARSCRWCPQHAPQPCPPSCRGLHPPRGSAVKRAAPPRRALVAVVQRSSVSSPRCPLEGRSPRCVLRGLTCFWTIGSLHNDPPQLIRCFNFHCHPQRDASGLLSLRHLLPFGCAGAQQPLRIEAFGCCRLRVGDRAYGRDGAATAAKSSRGRIVSHRAPFSGKPLCSAAASEVATAADFRRLIGSARAAVLGCLLRASPSP